MILRTDPEPATYYRSRRAAYDSAVLECETQLGILRRLLVLTSLPHLKRPRILILRVGGVFFFL